MVHDDTRQPEKGKNVIPILESLIKNIEQDYAQRAIVGMTAPPNDLLSSWIRQNWESIGIEVALTQAICNNLYIFLLKTPEMSLKALATDG